MQEVYKSLSAKVGLPDSTYLPEVWRILLTDEEAKAADALPQSAQDLSQLWGEPLQRVEPILNSLFRKGAAFKAKKADQVTYKLAKNIIQLHDACLLWDGASQPFFELWKKIMDQEFTAMLRNMPEDVQLPSFMRVIPIQQTLAPKSDVLTFEECEKMIDESATIAVVRCPCRLSQQNCDRPIETCIQLNRGAEYVVDRGHGRQIDKDEALAILKQAEEAGLVHMSENRSFGNAICNCCSCCCEMFRLMEFSGKSWILSPSRFLAHVNEACNACQACLDVCPTQAISLDGQLAQVSQADCIGCGLCANACPEDAIVLNPVRPKEHIPDPRPAR